MPAALLVEPPSVHVLGEDPEAFHRTDGIQQRCPDTLSGVGWQDDRTHQSVAPGGGEADDLTLSKRSDNRTVMSGPSRQFLGTGNGPEKMWA